MDLGDLRNAQTFFQKALELSRQNNEKPTEPGAWIWLGRVFRKADPSRNDRAKENILMESRLSPNESEFLGLGGEPPWEPNR
jgi:hypothetical protein